MPIPLRFGVGRTRRPLSFGAAHCGGPAHFAIAVPRRAIPREKSRLESLGVEVEGPVYESWPPPSHTRLFGDLDLKTGKLADADRVLRKFIPRAFRRPSLAAPSWLSRRLATSWASFAFPRVSPFSRNPSTAAFLATTAGNADAAVLPPPTSAQVKSSFLRR